MRVQNRLKITKNNCQGIIFVIISCQRVFLSIKKAFGSRCGAIGSCYGGGHRFPLRMHPFPFRASFNCFTVGQGLGPLRTPARVNSTSRFSSRCPSRCAVRHGYRVWIDLLTSYRIGRPRNSEIPRNMQKRDSPRNTFSDAPLETQKIRSLWYLGGIFLVFLWYFSISCCRGESDVGVVFFAHFGFEGFSIL